VARYRFTQTLLSDGRVLVAGGFNRQPTAISSAEIGVVQADGPAWTAAMTHQATPFPQRVRSNTYQVSYSGDDGNDLTLTVVP